MFAKIVRPEPERRAGKPALLSVVLVFLGPLSMAGAFAQNVGAPQAFLNDTGDHVPLNDALLDAFPEVRAGWSRLVEPYRKGYQFRLQMKYEFPSRKDRRPREEDDTISVMSGGAGLAIQSSVGNELRVFGPELQFTLRHSADSVDGSWFLVDTPRPVDASILKREFETTFNFGSGQSSDSDSNLSPKSKLYMSAVIAPLFSLTTVPSQGSVSMEKSEIIEDGQMLWRIDFAITGPDTAPSFVGSHGFIILDPNHDFRPIREEFTTSTGKTRETREFIYHDAGLASFDRDCNVFRRESNSSEWQHKNRYYWIVERKGGPPPDETFQLEHYGIKTGVPRRRFGWSTILIIAGILIVFIGGWGYVRQNRAA